MAEKVKERKISRILSNNNIFSSNLASAAVKFCTELTVGVFLSCTRFDVHTSDLTLLNVITSHHDSKSIAWRGADILEPLAVINKCPTIKTADQVDRPVYT